MHIDPLDCVDRDYFEDLKIVMAIMTNKIEKSAVWLIRIILHFLLYRIKLQILKQNWNKCLLVVIQQISIFYPHILSTEASFYIYDRPASERWICG